MRDDDDPCDFIGSGFTTSGGNIVAQEAGVYYIRQFSMKPKIGDYPVESASVTIDSNQFPGSKTQEPAEIIVWLDAGDTVSARAVCSNSNYQAVAYMNVARVS